MLSLYVAKAVSSLRLAQRLADLASFGARADGGVDRLALCAEECDARRWLVAPFLRRNGYQVGMDAAANLFIRRQGMCPDMPPLLFGSHIDTQPAGGRFDGAFGVCAGLEVLAALDDVNATTQYPLEVVIWNNEEGVRFSPGLTGSFLFTHPEQLADVMAGVGRDGRQLKEECAHAYHDMADFMSKKGGALIERPLGRPMAAYLEAHIEQGPLLEEHGLSVGCVTAIQATRWYAITVKGKSAHAGTTPMHARDDAMAKAVDLASSLLAYIGQQNDPQLRVTIGRWSTMPNAVNTIANEVCFSLDMRHPDEQALNRFLDDLNSVLLRDDVTIECLFDEPAQPFDTSLIGVIETASHALNIESTRLISGAFHDALSLAHHCPTAMLFAPSRDGISHHPDEFSSPDDLFRCTQVLAASIVELSEKHFCQQTKRM